MRIKERYQKILEYFQEHNPDAETELNFTSPYELLVSVMLSAQCTDERVNKVTPDLFLSFPDAYSLSKASQEAILDKIKSISYPNSKAKHLKKTAEILVDKHGGEVPLDMDELIQLPGVGRKTANVITSVLDQQPNMAVDTHVYRLSHRLGLVSPSDKTPLAVEKKLVKNIPEELVHKAHHWLILHGRYVCKARKPDCENCAIQEYCKSAPKYLTN